MYKIIPLTSLDLPSIPIFWIYKSFFTLCKSWVNFIIQFYCQRVSVLCAHLTFYNKYASNKSLDFRWNVTILCAYQNKLSRIDILSSSLLREDRLLNHRLSKLESVSPKTAQLCEIGQVLLRPTYSKNTYTSQNYRANHE